EKAAPATAPAWKLNEALEQLKLYPRDPYLQYVVLQLARREQRLDEVTKQVDEILFGRSLSPLGLTPDRRQRVDLFSLFTGALAVQESLQLDTMRGNGPQLPEGAAPFDKGKQEKQFSPAKRATLEKLRQETVKVASLSGPTVRSHPWEKMLGDQRPEVSSLSRCVPADFYLAEFRSLDKLLAALEVSDLWGKYLLNQGQQEARDHQVGERLKRQLALQASDALRPFYDLVVEEVAVTGSDLFLREGSDVTLLFRVKQPQVFKTKMDGFLDTAVKGRPQVEQTTGKLLGVAFVHLASPDGELNVYSAYPEENLHIRSNSKVALQRVLEAVRGKGEDGKPVTRLGETAEFRYIRTLMPCGAKEEDGLIYLSDPFIRHLVGPEVKLTERRRLLCYNHLRMIGHAAQMYRTEHGKSAASLEDLIAAKCCPGKFNEGKLVCPDGGRYQLAPDGACGVCSHHGNAHALTPCCEIPVTQVNGEEADLYRQFLDDYNQYWRTYFDPIAVRLQVAPKCFRLETIILPLQDNSVYTGMAKILGGKPEHLDALPLTPRTIFSINVRLNKEDLLRELDAGQAREVATRVATLTGAPMPGFPRAAVWATLATAELSEHPSRSGTLGDLGVSASAARELDFRKLFAEGLGDQVGMHICDAAPMFDLNVPSLLGQLLGSFSTQGGDGRASSLGLSFLPIGFMAASLTRPTYISLPVRDAKVVDAFLERFDRVTAAQARQQQNLGAAGFFSLGLEQDFYKFPLQGGKTARSYNITFGPLKFRTFWARIDDGLYITNQPFVLEDLLAAKAARAKGKNGDLGPKAHAMVRLRPNNWEQVLTSYRLGWA
ncbi:MAG TPA: hypothetical protein VEL76_34005, partial [Gemmataceae bacterium]|nr:hypothetical protein [Gemmataceae bacterium]